jgi:hypothetical protein
MGLPTAKVLRAAGIEPTYIAQVSEVEKLFQGYSVEVLHG